MIERMIERLARSGIETEIGAGHAMVRHDGFTELRVPMRLQLIPSAIEAVIDASHMLGGTVRSLADDDGTIGILLSSRPDLNRDFVRT
jgi:hypothetical protein